MSTIWCGVFNFLELLFYMTGIKQFLKNRITNMVEGMKIRVSLSF